MVSKYDQPSMGPWDAAEFLDSKEAMLAYLEAVFGDGGPERIAAAPNDVARARGVDRAAGVAWGVSGP